MTKPVTPDEGFPKYHMPLEEANKIIEHNMKLLEGDTLGLCGAGASGIASIGPKRAIVKPAVTRAKMTSFKSKVGKIMHKLYDLEPDNAPEKPLNVDLGVDLYQMEDY